MRFKDGEEVKFKDGSVGVVVRSDRDEEGEHYLIQWTLSTGKIVIGWYVLDDLKA